MASSKKVVAFSSAAFLLLFFVGAMAVVKDSGETAPSATRNFGRWLSSKNSSMADRLEDDDTPNVHAVADPEEVVSMVHIFLGFTNRSTLSILMPETGNTNVAKPEPWEKSNHPLFLHHSDQPGAILVSQPLVEDNYTTWQQSMMMALTIKNKSGFVDGTLIKPVNKPVEESQWERCNVLVKTWLLGSMSKDISKSVIHCKDARGIWLELQARFSQTNIVSLFNIEKEIHDCQQGTDSVTSFFTKLKSLWEERDALAAVPPCSCTAAVAIKTFITNQQTMQFLMGLNSEYEQIRSTIISLDPFPDSNKAFSMVFRQEQQFKMSQTQPPVQADSTAFSVKKPRDNHPPGEAKHCEKCNMTNHNTQQCRAHLKCTFCNNKGHTIDYCRKRKKLLDNGQAGSSVNHAHTSNNNTSLSSIEYQQVMDLLNRFKLPDTNPQSLTDNSHHSAANQVGNIPHYDHFSGPSIGEDDWEGI